LLDLEINLVVEDRAFTREIKEICLADEKDSECITIEKWQQRPVLQRVMERMARIFSAQL
jgi:phosphatidylserine/phosphatidylglycerophosphate/cardiolipin synthase-like enzyme